MNRLTGTELEVKTNGRGQYSISSLEPGVYRVYVQAPGFTPAVSSAVTLNVAQNAVLDFTLKLGSASDQVILEASATSIHRTPPSAR